KGMVEVTVTLQETKTTRIFVAESGSTSSCRIIQRAPDAFAGASPQGESIRVVYFRPPVHCGRFDGFGKPVHRAHGSNSETSDILPEKERRVYVHQHCFVSTHIESIGTRDTRTFQ